MDHKRLCCRLVAASLAVGVAPARAQTAPSPGVVDSLNGASDVARPHRLRLPIIGFAASSGTAGRSYALQMRPADHGRLTTSIEYRLFQRGPTGSLGLQTSRDGPDIRPDEVNNAAALGPRGSEARVGARLSYHF
jgi:hypothetical protein